MRRFKQTSKTLFLILPAYLFSHSGWMNYATAETLDLPKYISLYMKNSEELQTANSELTVSKNNLDIAEDLFQTTFLLESTKSRHQFSYLTSIQNDATDDSLYLTGAISQKFSTGSELLLSATDYLENSEPAFGSLMADKSITLKQALFKNAFGSLDRKKVLSAHYSFESQKFSFEQSQLDICITGTDIYLSTFLSQKKLTIYEDILKESERALKITSNAYKKRLVRKIDYLAAQADHLKIMAAYEQSKQEHLQRQNQFLTEINNENKSQSMLKTELIEPNQLDSSPGIIDFENSTAYLTSQSQVKSAEQNYQIEKSSTSADLDLSIKIGQAQRQDTNSEEYEDNYILASLNFSWPAHNNTLQAKYRSALENKNIAINQKKRLEKEFKIESKNILSALENFKIQLKLSQQKSGFFQDQIKEANRLLANGKLEYEEFIRYRDSFLNEKLAYWEIKNKIWQKNARLANLSRQAQSFCGELK